MIAGGLANGGSGFNNSNGDAGGGEMSFAGGLDSGGMDTARKGGGVGGLLRGGGTGGGELSFSNGGI